MGIAFSTDADASNTVYLDGQLAGTVPADGPSGELMIPVSAPWLQNGKHTVYVISTDPAGNVSALSPTITFIVDVPPPAPAFSSKPPAATTSASATFTFSDGVGADIYECSLDGAPFTVCTSPASVQGVRVGAHTFAARSVNALGTSSAPTSVTWTVSAPAPRSPQLTVKVSDHGRALSVTVSAVKGAAGTLKLSATDGKLRASVREHGQSYTFTALKAGRWKITVTFTGKPGWKNQTLTRTVTIAG